MAKRPPRKRRLNKGTPFDFLADMVSDLIDRTLERAQTIADSPSTSSGGPNFVWIFRCPNCATTIQVISATGPTRFIMCPSCGWNVPQPGTFVPPRQTAPPPPPRPPSRRRKDYYVTLGLRSNATADEIKTAYRRLALECHPDRKPGDAGAVERFKEIAEAYETLGNPEKRRVYDISG